MLNLKSNKELRKSELYSDILYQCLVDMYEKLTITPFAIKNEDENISYAKFDDLYSMNLPDGKSGIFFENNTVLVSLVYFEKSFEFIEGKDSYLVLLVFDKIAKKVKTYRIDYKEMKDCQKLRNLMKLLSKIFNKTSSLEKVEYQIQKHLNFKNYNFYTTKNYLN